MIAIAARNMLASNRSGHELGERSYQTEAPSWEKSLRRVFRLEIFKRRCHPAVWNICSPTLEVSGSWPKKKEIVKIEEKNQSVPGSWLKDTDS